MARISLRDYNREIEELVDSGRTEEAIAHCRYILETYPKHITTYRSLGKALLESQRYGDAADVFMRVLACIPDDFIAHLGMSIIREDEGDLDGSIWHMERAFEVQPSNAAVQSELRRLYGRRDGLTPAKVQLTRGAMARMSAKSHLYSQAIAELRTALADDPQRPDLQTLLARMYTQTGQRLAAIETCNVLLGKFPYCLEANRLMVEILPGTERAAEAETYRRRLEELDPYESHISLATGTADQVQGGAITLERLDYLDVHVPIEPGATQPEWTSSPGVSVDQTSPSEEPLPDWLSATEESPASGEQDAIKEPLSGTEIPDWMHEAGWEPASGEAGEPGFEQNLTGEPVPGEPGTLPLTEGDETHKAGVLGGTGAILPEAEGAIILGASLAAGAVLSTGENEVKETEIEEPTQIESAGEAAEEELPDRFAPTSEETEIQAESESLPDWLVSAPEEIQPAESEIELPEWLAPVEEPVSRVEVAGLAAAAIGAAELIDKDETPSLAEPGPEVANLPPVESAPQSVSAWLTESAAEIPPESPIGEIEEEEQVEGVPEWLAKLSPETYMETSATFVSDTDEQESDQEQAEIPKWLREMEGSLSGETVESTGTETPEPLPMEIEDTGLEASEIPDWLKAAIAVKSVDQIVEPIIGKSESTEAPLLEGDTKPVRIHAAQVEPIIEEPVELLPGETEQVLEAEAVGEIQIEQAEQTEPDRISTAEFTEVAEVTPLPDDTVVPGFESEDEAMIWLESLAARQGSMEEEPLTSPEERPAETPEWIPQFTDESVEVGEITEEEERPAENGSEIDRLAGVAAAGLVAKQLFEAEATEEPVMVVPEPAEELPEESLAETVQGEPSVEPVGISTMAESGSGEWAPPAEFTTIPPSTIPELELAWQNIANGNIPTAVDQYSHFIRQEQHMDEIINEIQKAVMIYPLDSLLYQTLGDAYLRANRFQEAMEAYNRAEDLLR